MTETTLALTFNDLREEVAESGWGGQLGSVYQNLPSNVQARVVRLVNQGLRRFYNPPSVNGKSHRWSFMTPTVDFVINAPYGPEDVGSGTFTYVQSTRQVTISGTSPVFPSWVANGFFEHSGVDYDIDTRDSDTTLTLTVNNNIGSDVSTASSAWNIHQDIYQLPDDFATIKGHITFVQKQNAWYECIIVSEQSIRDLTMRDYNQNFSTGEPLKAAIRPSNRVESQGTQQEIYFWPSITAAATAIYTYQRRGDALTSPNGYPWGASDHSETILQSCLAAAEQRIDEEMGIHSQQFMQYLEASIIFDGRANRPEQLGYNRDMSDGVDMFGHSRHSFLGVNSATGVTYVGQGSL